MNTNNSSPTPSHTPITEIAFILDRSGSMCQHTEAAITGFNEFLRGQKEVDGIARLSLILFDDRYEVPVDNLPIHEVLELDTRTYCARGTTALLDAIGRTIVSFRKRQRSYARAGQSVKIIFAIFTDGFENASHHYTWRDIAHKIRRYQDREGWEFLFLAANQDAIATASQMGIDHRNAATASNSAMGVSGSSRAFSRKIQAMREHYQNTDLMSDDFSKPMSDILREEEDRND